MGSHSGWVRAMEHPSADNASLLSQYQEPWQLAWVTSWPQAPSLPRNECKWFTSGSPPRRQMSSLASSQSLLTSVIAIFSLSSIPFPLTPVSSWFPPTPLPDLTYSLLCYFHIYLFSVCQALSSRNVMENQSYYSCGVCVHKGRESQR